MISAGAPALRAFLDSGAPPGSTNYTTIVVIHGLIWHGGEFFKKLLPLAAAHNARVIALNRRDYPGSKPYSEQERVVLTRLASSSPDSPSTREEAWDFLRERAREVYEYLADLVKRESIPPVQGSGQDAKGAIVLAGWSLGAIWPLAFLAHAPSLRSPEVDLSQYVRRVISHDCAFGFFLYAPPSQIYHPLWDSSLPPEERIKRFHDWAAAYFPHGDPIEADTLVFHDTLDGPSSLKNMTSREQAESTHEAPGHSPNGSDTLIAKMCATHGLYNELKNATFYPTAGKPADEARDPWRDVELRVVWCDQSLWAIPWVAKGMATELEEAKRTGRDVRRVSLVRLRGGNHFAHRDYPGKVLRSFLGDDAHV
ncbi:Alpha/Beta hydrolase protein [Cerioporus squamosus]|nr:Alpha/Beta hydrolase protein [Cerioporus squamosus]